MYKIWAKKALKSRPKSNKSPNLVTLVVVAFLHHHSTIVSLHVLETQCTCTLVVAAKNEKV